VLKIEGRGCESKIWGPCSYYRSKVGGGKEDKGIWGSCSQITLQYSLQKGGGGEEKRSLSDQGKVTGEKRGGGGPKLNGRRMMRTSEKVQEVRKREGKKGMMGRLPNRWIFKEVGGGANHGRVQGTGWCRLFR